MNLEIIIKNKETIINIPDIKKPSILYYCLFPIKNNSYIPFLKPNNGLFFVNE